MSNLKSLRYETTACNRPAASAGLGPALRTGKGRHRTASVRRHIGCGRCRIDIGDTRRENRPPVRPITRTLPAEPGKEPQLNEHEIAILNPETQEWEVSEFAISESRHSPADLYLEGGYGWMTALTLCLIAMLFCTWKAPRWIKELGLLACTLGVLSMMIGFYSILQIIQTTGYSVTFTLLSGGLRVAFIAPIYGLIIYALSLLLRIAVKPRI